ncbi:MAG: HAMP domain-containing sensor histidine kinase [Bacteroidetes bacterium]|nr:HAMP domain-containing sensor histidine kinase [Bacteroidota bacterium]MDA0973185.1 HAMP domain-containing sensor histidine kinase [Bacteroidota bacterium]
MKKYWIFAVIGLMMIAMFGLVAIQYQFFQNSITLKEAQFRYTANTALVQVDEELQRQEAKQRLLKSQEQKKNLEHLDSIQRVFTTGWDKEHGFYMKDTIIRTEDGEIQLSYSTYREYDNTGELTNDFRRQVGVEMESQGRVMREMVNDMFSFEFLLPLPERLNHQELQENVDRVMRAYGIDTKSRSAIFDSFGRPIIHDADDAMEELVALSKTKYRVRVFANDILSEPYYLHVDFPEERSYVKASLTPLVLTSGGFILLIMAAFAFTVAIIFRQKRVSEIKNDFINNMTHELKTPVSTISLACEALSDPDMKRSGMAMDRYVGMIREENKRLGSLVENVLRSAVVDRGTLELNLSEEDIHVLIEEALDRFSLQFKEREALVEKDFQAAPSLLKIDAAHLRNVIGNLIDNALKYSPTGPKIRVVTTSIGHVLRIDITDQGIGIKTEDQKKVFDTLYRVPKGNTHDVKGFGLGLSYVKAIVEKHGGRVLLRSEWKLGSTFSIELPYERA